MSREERLMGVDHGEKRIGIALSDPLGIIAAPLVTLEAVPKGQVLERLAELVEEHNVNKIVFGLPTDSEGKLGPQARKALRWARSLAEAVPAQVVMWDEFYSTREAALYTRRGKRRRGLDAVAAAVILQSYLEARRTTYEPGRPLPTFGDAL